MGLLAQMWMQRANNVFLMYLIFSKNGKNWNWAKYLHFVSVIEWYNKILYNKTTKLEENKRWNGCWYWEVQFYAINLVNMFSLSLSSLYKERSSFPPPRLFLLSNKMSLFIEWNGTWDDDYYYFQCIFLSVHTNSQIMWDVNYIW